MDWISSDIAIGNYKDALDRKLLNQEGIRSVLGLVGTLAQIEPDDHGLDEIEIVELIDGVGNRQETFEDALDALEDLLKYSPPVMVHCHAGRSRSVVVVAGHLMRSSGLSKAAALEAVASRRAAAVTQGLERLLDGVRSERT